MNHIATEALNEMKMKTAATNITVPVANVRKAMRESGARGVVKIVKGKRNVRVNLSAVPRNFLERLVLTPLSEMISEKVQAHLKETLVVPGTDPFETLVSGPQELWTVLNAACPAGKPSLETQFPNGEWYPIAIQTHVHTGFFGEFLRIQANAKVCDHNERMDIRIYGPFVDPENNPTKRSVKEVLAARRLRPLTPERLEVFRKRQAKLRGIADNTGLVLDNTKPVLYVNRFLWMQSLDTRDLGTPEMPATVIVEPSLESASQEDYYDEEEGEVTLTYPFVRVFSLDLKKYVYADVEAVVPHVYPVANKDRIVLPTEIRSVLDNIFNAGNSKLFSDAFSGRHGGMVILANGPSGVGKTLTAEVFSQTVQRPLYILEVGELGTNVTTVEQNLEKIFARAARWNAVLLFDEADIFLTARDERDLERNAIVGVFLRLLDYYQGTFFLTTNRAEVLDPAFKSRITLRLDYPGLDHSTRQRIWEIMLTAAKFDISNVNLEVVSETNVNGRQIRNMVRLLTVLNPTKTINTVDVERVLRFTA